MILKISGSDTDFIKNTPYQKWHEIKTGAHWLVVDFRRTNKQFSFLCESLVYEKSDQHNSVFDSYNIELASTKIKTIAFEHAASTYSVFNRVKFNTSNEHHKYLLYCQFVTYVCYGYSIAPITDYANNVVYQELPNQKDCFSISNKKLYVNLRRSKGCTGELEMISRYQSDLILTIILKQGAAKKMELTVTGYYQGKYLYALSRSDLLLTYKE